MWLIPPFIEANSDNPGWGNTIEDCKGGILLGNVEVLERDNTIISWPPRFAKVCHDLLLLPAQSRSHILWKKSDSGITFWTPSQPLSPIYSCSINLMWNNELWIMRKRRDCLSLWRIWRKASPAASSLSSSMSSSSTPSSRSEQVWEKSNQFITGWRQNQFFKKSNQLMSPTFRFRRRPHWGTGIGDEWDTKSVSRF